MDTQQLKHDVEIDNPNDIEVSKPSKSRFLFLLSFFGFFIFAWSGCYNLWQHKYVSNSKVEVPDNTKYDPTYK